MGPSDPSPREHWPDNPGRVVVRPRPDDRRWLPTADQRRGLAGLVLIASLALAVTQLRRPATIADPPPPRPVLYGELADRLDPNLATAAELGVLPGLGPSKAGAIVEYREASGSRPAFRDVGDLTRVRGIGPAIAAKLAPYLRFPDAGR